MFRGPSEPAPPGEWERFEAALEDDFNTPDALAVMHGWRDHELLRRALDIFGLASLAEEEEAPSEIVELAKQRQEARAARDFDEADRLRAEIEAAGWEARDVADGLPARPAMTRDQLYGRRPVREALRGPREVLELWATERAVKSEPWLQRGRAPAACRSSPSAS